MAKPCASPSTKQLAESLNAGLAHHRAGRLAEAWACYAAILKLQPAHADALHLSGLIAREEGDLAASERLIVQAIQSRSSVAVFHYNLGYTYELLGKQSEAVECYRCAVSLDPGNLAAVQRFTGAIGEHADPAEAIALYEALLNHTPDSTEALYDLGRLHQRRGVLPSALTCYRRAVSLQPGCFEFQFNLAAALFASGQFAEAAESYQQAILLKPEDAEAHYSLGVVQQTRGEVKLASQAYVSAIRIRPDFPEALSNLGSLCVDMGDPQTAEGLLRRSIALDPGNASAHCNLASALTKQGNTAEAVQSFRNALALDPTHALTLCNLGTHLETSGDAEGAVRCYQLALASHPDSQLAQFFLSLQHLLEGDFAAGWQGYEARWGTPQFLNTRPARLQPQWRGEDIRGSRIILYREQGFGDTLQFVRYAPMVAALGAKVVLKVQPSLVRLLSSLHSAIKVVSTESDEEADEEWQCPLLSLPLAFGTDLATIPRDVPYLRADPIAAEAWSHRFPARGLRVGLVCAGNPTHTRDRQRSVAWQQLGSLSRLQEVTFYSLQKGPVSQDLASSPLRIVDLSRHLEDFADTAAIVSNLDLVISVDTAVAHLAGAMGKPVWVLVPRVSDWRWLRDRTDSPWYPTMRLFRQTAIGRWDNVLEQIEQELIALASTQHPSPAYALRGTDAVALQA
jgi:tetratricopeptide (TPR) repeat protein